MLKQGIHCTKGSSYSIQERLSKFLLSYRITPIRLQVLLNSSKLLTNRRLRLQLDLLHPEISGKVEAKQKSGPNKPIGQFSENDNVFVRKVENSGGLTGTTLKATSPLLRNQVARWQDSVLSR